MCSEASGRTQLERWKHTSLPNILFPAAPLRAGRAISRSLNETHFNIVPVSCSPASAGSREAQGRSARQRRAGTRIHLLCSAAWVCVQQARWRLGCWKISQSILARGRVNAQRESCQGQLALRRSKSAAGQGASPGLTAGRGRENHPQLCAGLAGGAPAKAHPAAYSPNCTLSAPPVIHRTVDVHYFFSRASWRGRPER